MSTPHVIIIGAGAAGLISAVELGKSGRKVTLLEARDRVGGRMHTLTNGFDQPTEGGAEFIHGDLPITKKLLDDAGITYREAEGGFYEREEDGIKPMQGATEEDKYVKQKLDSLEQDITVAQFIQQYLAGDEHAETREELQSFVEGFDSGDINKASAFTLRDELSARQEPQYRIDGGYIKLVGLLTQQCRDAGVEITLNTQVRTIDWQRGDVIIHTAFGEIYKGDTALVTVPLAVLLEDIEFNPAIPKHMTAAKEIGYGSVIKVLLQFDKAFWKEGKFGAEDLSFLFSDTKIPTFWTQYPNDSNVLIGWLCGPKAVEIKDWDDVEILMEAMQSVSKTFDIVLPALQRMLTHSEVHNWTADPFTKGAYAYSTVDGTKQREILRSPIANTVFFAGEGLYIGDHYGTVEAALESGLHAVQQILTASNTKG